MISPNIMSLALKYKNWKEGYRWCAYIQLFILFICIITLPLWQIDKKEDKSKNKEELKEDNKEQKEQKEQKQNEESENRVIKINVIKKVDSQKELEYNNNIVETKEDMKKEETKKKEVNTKKEEKEKEKEDKIKVISIIEAIKIKGVAFSCLAFFSYCSGEGTCFLWTSSFFDRTKDGLSKESIASLSTTIFGGLMLGRVLSGLVSEKFGDKKLIRIGLIVECIGIICVGIPIKTYVLAIIGYCLISIGMGPIYPSIQHLAPIYFGKEASATVIGLQMAAAYVGTTFMPFIFGLIQSKTSMWAHPIYVGVFAIFNFIFIEIEFKIGDKNIVSNENENKEMTNKENSEGGNIKK